MQCSDWLLKCGQVATLEAAIGFLEQRRQAVSAVDSPLGRDDETEDGDDDGSKDDDDLESEHCAGALYPGQTH